MEYLTAREAAARADKLLEHDRMVELPRQELQLLKEVLFNVDKDVKAKSYWVGEVSTTPEGVIQKLKDLGYEIAYEAREKKQSTFFPNPLGGEFVEWYRIYW